MTATPRRRTPTSTYRVQFRPGFGFVEARALVPYLAQLGVTTWYSSPHLRARPGSTHGYDICDPSQLNPELGTMADYEAFSGQLQGHGLGHVVDVVPNHMAADSNSNPWWRDVLENGPSSRFSDFFDIDWDPIKPELTGCVLLPVLGDQYGLVLERGELRLTFDAGTLVLMYGGMTLPVNPRSIPLVLGLDQDVVGHSLKPGTQDSREYLSVLTALANLPLYTERAPDRVEERTREKAVARDRLARLVQSSPEVRAHVDACVRLANGKPGEPSSFDILHDLLEHQAYRLAYWRTAFDEINYRRFFDVNGLVALRMEDPAVFEASHALVRDLVAAGHITGLRVDHPDGLFDPQAYLDRLQAMVGGAFYIVVEKILSPGEELSGHWPVSGTTGYDFLNQVAGLFVDIKQIQALRRAYARLTGRQVSFADLAYQSKRTITLTSMASELSVLAQQLNRLSESDRRSRDFTLDSCRKALREVLACVPVYRTYISDRGWSEFDRTVIDAAIRDAMLRNPVMEASILEFIHDVLIPAAEPKAGTSAPHLAERRRFAMKFQQFSGPVQAKGVEDTAFYRHHVLAAANDVGGHPDRPGTSVEEFHEANARRLARRPDEMLATSTHDTKRGEDARVRLSVISEMPTDWRRAVQEWMRINARHRTRNGTLWLPDRNDEYLLYQAVLGAWPPEHADAPVPQRAPDGFVARIDAYMQKAVREAKVHTSWIDKNEAYGNAVGAFVRGALSSKTSARFLASLVPFARRLSRAGAVNSIAQLTLKLASPGVPDFYQGSELWDLTLVDPDNRHLIDYTHRRQLLESLEPLVAAAQGGRPVEDGVEELAAEWTDGRIKLLVTTCGLRFRRDHAGFMARSAYLPLEVEGPLADHVVAFARHDNTGTLIAIAPRLVAGLVTGTRLAPQPDTWGATQVRLPSPLHTATYTHVITGTRISVVGEGVMVGAVLRVCPAALFWSPGKAL